MLVGFFLVGRKRRSAILAMRSETSARLAVGNKRIGIFSSLASGFLAKLFQAYDAGHASVRLDLIEGGPSDHVPAAPRPLTTVSNSMGYFIYAN